MPTKPNTGERAPRTPDDLRARRRADTVEGGQAAGVGPTSGAAMLRARRLAIWSTWVWLVACGGADTGAYTVGGTVGGLDGTLVLQLGQTQSLSVHADGPFVFAKPQASGTHYAVTIQSQPKSQSCVVTHGTGVVDHAAIDDVSISCTLAFGYYPVGGTVTGLPETKAGGLVLTEGSGRVQVDADGTFTLPDPLPDGAVFSVQLATLPDGLDCTVLGGQGYVASAPVDGITVACGPSRAIRLSVRIAGATPGPVAVIRADTQVDPDPALQFTAQSPQVQLWPQSFAYGDAYTLQLVAPNTLRCSWDAAVGSAELTGRAQGNAVLSATCVPAIALRLQVVATGVTRGVLWVDDQQATDPARPLAFDPTQTAPQAFEHAYVPQETYSLVVVPPPGLACSPALGSPGLQGPMQNDTTVALACAPAPGQVVVGVSGLGAGQLSVVDGPGGDATRTLSFASASTDQAQAFAHTYTDGDLVTLTLSADGATCYFATNGGTALTQRIGVGAYVAVHCAP